MPIMLNNVRNTSDFIREFSELKFEMYVKALALLDIEVTYTSSSLYLNGVEVLKVSSFGDVNSYLYDLLHTLFPMVKKIKK